MGRWWHGSNGGDDVADLREEVDRLTQENMRLRLDRQRPMSLGEVAADLRRVASDGDTVQQAPADADAVDEAQHLLAQAMATRASVLDVVQSLQTAAGHLERQLVAGVSLMEVDRRLRPRREGDGGRRAELVPGLSDLPGPSDLPDLPDLPEQAQPVGSPAVSLSGGGAQRHRHDSGPGHAAAELDEHGSREARSADA